MWLERSNASTLPPSTSPSIVIVTDKIPTGANSKKEAKATFLEFFSKEAIKSLYEQVSAIDIITIYPSGSISVNSHYRRLKKHLIYHSRIWPDSKAGRSDLAEKGKLQTIIKITGNTDHLYFSRS